MQPTATPDPEVFLANMSALWRQDPKLAQRIDRVHDEDRLPLVPTRSGQLTTFVESKTGKLFLHSRYDPLAEAKKLIDAVPFDDKFCFVVSGFGLGYHVRELFNRLKGDAFIIACEPSIKMLATALAAVDLSAAINTGRLIILDSLDKSALHEHLRRFNTLIMLGAQFVAHPPSRALDDTFHAAARRLIADYVAYQRMTLLTLVGNSQVTCRNIAHNLPTYLSTPPVNQFHDRFHKKPAIVISGGPSLRKNIDLLAKAKNHAVLIAVQTTFKPLLARGIVPDFVTSLDFHAISEQFFAGVEDFHGVHLIAEPKVSWHVIDAYKGPVSFVHNHFAEELVGPDLARRAALRPGATVAHLAFYFAQFMGCDPIIFVGQDLAFTGHCFYLPGVEIHHSWQSEMNRFNTLETKEWERIARNRTILRKVTDIDGRDIYTDDLLFTYQEQFERDFAQSPATVIDATEGGARIRHTQVLTLRDALDRHAADPLPKGAFDYRKSQNTEDVARLSAGQREIESRIAEIQQLRDVSDEMLTLLDDLTKLVDDPNQFNRKLIRVDELRAVVTRSNRAYSIVNAASQLAELQRYNADKRLELTTLKGPELAKRQLERDIRFVTAVRKGTDEMITDLRKTVKRFQKQLRATRASSEPPAPHHQSRDRKGAVLDSKTNERLRPMRLDNDVKAKQ